MTAQPKEYEKPKHTTSASIDAVHTAKYERLVEEILARKKEKTLPAELGFMLGENEIHKDDERYKDLQAALDYAITQYDVATSSRMPASVDELINLPIDWQAFFEGNNHDETSYSLLYPLVALTTQIGLCRQKFTVEVAIDIDKAMPESHFRLTNRIKSFGGNANWCLANVAYQQNNYNYLEDDPIDDLPTTREFLEIVRRGFAPPRAQSLVLLHPDTANSSQLLAGYYHYLHSEVKILCVNKGSAQFSRWSINRAQPLPRVS